MRAALFVTCLTYGVVLDVAKATVRLLRRLEVDVPLEQTCCGQMHVNTGCPREAFRAVIVAKASDLFEYKSVRSSGRLVRRPPSIVPW